MQAINLERMQERIYKNKPVLTKTFSILNVLNNNFTNKSNTDVSLT